MFDSRKSLYNGDVLAISSFIYKFIDFRKAIVVKNFKEAT